MINVVAIKGLKATLQLQIAGVARRRGVLAWEASTSIARSWVLCRGVETDEPEPFPPRARTKRVLQLVHHKRNRPHSFSSVATVPSPTNGSGSGRSVSRLRAEAPADRRDAR